MLTAKYKDTGEVFNILDFENPRGEIDKNRLVCKFCEQQMFIRQGFTRERHFYHYKKCTSKLNHHPESAEHEMGKHLISLHIVQNWKEYGNVKIELEYPLPEINRIADIALIFPSGWVVVHEIQLSSITSESLHERTKDYHSIGIDTFWWLGNRADTYTNRVWCIKKFGFSLNLDYTILSQQTKRLDWEHSKGNE